jgi:hypothetical protein
VRLDVRGVESVVVGLAVAGLGCGTAERGFVGRD